MGKKPFRSTLWFKRGEQAEPAGAEPAIGAECEAVPPSPMLLPIEDRYLEDGSVTAADTSKYGLHIGTTQCVAVVTDAPVEVASQPHALRTLVGELKHGRRRVFAALGVTAAAAGAVVCLYVF